MQKQLCAEESRIGPVSALFNAHLFGIVFVLFLALGAQAAAFTDLLGRTVDVAKSDRIVCIGPGALRLAVYMQLENRLAGIEQIERKAINQVPYRLKLGKTAIMRLPVIGQGGPGKLPAMEALLASAPDLIFTSFLDPSQIRIIEAKTGIPVLALSYGGSYGGLKNQRKMEAIVQSLRLMGTVTGRTERAQELADFMQAEKKRLQALALQPGGVYIGGIGYKGSQGIASTESGYPPFALLGLRNAVLDGKIVGHAFVQEEAILKADPDFIFFDLGGRGVIGEEIAKKKKLFQSLKAYREKHVAWLLPYNFYNTNVENIFVNAWLIAGDMDVPVTTERLEAVYRAFYGPRGEAILKTFLPLRKFL